MENEIFRSIEGAEYYKVSNRGRVKSDGRYSSYRNVPVPETILKPQALKSGHLFVIIRGSKYPKGKSFLVHRLVAKAFPEICGEWFDDCEVHHIDGDKTNNNAYNLAVLSRDEHCKIHYHKKEKWWPYMNLC